MINLSQGPTYTTDPICQQTKLLDWFSFIFGIDESESEEEETMILTNDLNETVTVKYVNFSEVILKPMMQMSLQFTRVVGCFHDNLLGHPRDFSSEVTKTIFRCIVCGVCTIASVFKDRIFQQLRS